MAETKAGRSEPSRDSSVTVTAEPVKRGGESRSLTIKLRKRKPDKKVEWSTDTVDNEHQGRMSSKCCCIYKKPRAFGESSTESEDEQDESCGHTHCIRGHPKAQSRPGPGGGGPSAALTLGAGPSQPPPDPAKP